ncbi:MAG: hypothetical protein H7317_05595 [Pseudorhodobacter sp.]|nr:hypothetical protein [Pseudorhodobacter sp.]
MENRETIRETIVAAPLTAGGSSDRAYVDWAAVIGGAVIAVSIGILATGFGAALGLSSISAQKGEDTNTLGLVLSALWIAISMVCSYAAGGYVAGRMRRRVDGAASSEVTVRDGMNGLIVWALGVLLSAMVVSSAISTTVSAVGNVASAAGTAVAQVAGGAASGAISAAGNMVPDGIKADPMSFITGSMLRPAAVNPQTAGSDATTADAGSVLTNLMTTGEISDADHAYLVQLTAARTGLSQPDATARVDQAVTAAKDAKDKAAEIAAEAERVARDAAETARHSAILTAFLLTAMALVSGVAAYVAAVRGGRHRDEGRVFGGFAYHR